MKFAEIKNSIVRNIIFTNKKPKNYIEKIEKVKRIDQSNYKILSGKTTITTEYIEIKNQKVGVKWTYKDKHFIPPKPPAERHEPFPDGEIIKTKWILKKYRWVEDE